ncbi:MAG: hypothetical protein JSV51_01725, partial [Candidatus Bathyarchaeota archaeon]
PLTVAGPSGTQYVFTGWSGDASGSASPSDAITMDGPKTAVANWKTQYYLTVQTDPLGIASIPGEGWYDASTNAPLTAPTVGGYSFLNWDVDSISQGDGIKSISVSMNAPYTTTAHYEEQIVVGGSTVSIKSPQLTLWMGLNAMFTAAIFVAAFWLKKRQSED